MSSSGKYVRHELGLVALEGYFGATLVNEGELALVVGPSMGSENTVLCNLLATDLAFDLSRIGHAEVNVFWAKRYAQTFADARLLQFVLGDVDGIEVHREEQWVLLEVLDVGNRGHLRRCALQLPEPFLER
jgi:hypothetical protein